MFGVVCQCIIYIREEVAVLNGFKNMHVSNIASRAVTVIYLKLGMDVLCEYQKSKISEKRNKSTKVVMERNFFISFNARSVLTVLSFCFLKLKNFANF